MWPVHRAYDPTTFMCQICWNLVASTFCILQGFFRPVQDLLYFFYIYRGDRVAHSIQWLGYQLNDLKSERWQGKEIVCSPKWPYRLWDLPSLLFSWYGRGRLFLQGKSSWGMTLTSHLYLGLSLIKSRFIFLLLLYHLFHLLQVLMTCKCVNWVLMKLDWQENVVLKYSNMSLTRNGNGMGGRNM